MELDSFYGHTNAQKAAFEAAFEDVVPAVISLLRKARAAHDAIVALPANNEAGQPVLHGANKDMYRIRNTLLSVATSYCDLMDRDLYDFIRFHFMHAGSGFCDAEIWEKDYGHLVDWSVKLAEKFPAVAALLKGA